jgi:hypothetical protein
MDIELKLSDNFIQCIDISGSIIDDIYDYFASKLKYDKILIEENYNSKNYKIEYKIIKK